MNELQSSCSFLRAAPLIKKTELFWKNFIVQKSLQPFLHVILLGDNNASKLYIKRKVEACSRIGIKSVVHELHESTSENQLKTVINKLNTDNECHGILVQAPLPNHINIDNVFGSISPEKDVDGFHPINRGKHLLNLDTFVPCTTLGIIRLLKYYSVSLEGKRIALFGRSHIVGTPTQIALQQEHATVTQFHSKSNLNNISLQQYDIIILATGTNLSFLVELIQKHHIIIDVGIRNIGNKIYGDLGPDVAYAKAMMRTPVPGGVGPMTVNSLMFNTIVSYLRLTETPLETNQSFIEHTLSIKD